MASTTSGPAASDPFADVYPAANVTIRARVLDSVQRVVTFRNFVIAVALCLIASASMALAPFVSPSTPLFPFMATNWVLWIVVAGVFRRSRAEWITHSESIWWDWLTALALIAFTIAGFFAVHHADTLIHAGDMAQLR